MNDIVLKVILSIVILSMLLIILTDGFFPKLEEPICNKIMPKVGAICFVVIFILLLLHFTGIWRLSV